MLKAGREACMHLPAAVYLAMEVTLQSVAVAEWVGPAGVLEGVAEWVGAAGVTGAVAE